MLLSWILTVDLGSIRSLRDSINLGALTNTPIKRYPSNYTYGSTSLGSRLLNHGWYLKRPEILFEAPSPGLELMTRRSLVRVQPPLPETVDAIVTVQIEVALDH